jgi:glycosyltransferase involved in cell wall biosynthesis
VLEHKKSAFDVLNCHSVSYAGRYGVFAKKFIRLPIVMTPHGGDIHRVPEIEYGIRMNSRWNRIVKNNLRNAEAITAISDSVKDELDFVNQEKIFIVPNGIHQGHFSTSERFYLHDYLNIGRGKKIVLSVGRNHIVKGYKYGVKTFALLRDLNWCPDAVYVIIGRGVLELSGAVIELGLEERVFLVDEISSDELNHCYSSSHLFFSPSLIEGLSMASIEAMGHGLPLVVTDVPGNRDVVRDNDCGIIVPSEDVLSMAKAIRKLLSHETIRQEYADRSLRHSTRYDWKNIAKLYLQVYKTVVEQKRMLPNA